MRCSAPISMEALAERERFRRQGAPRPQFRPGDEPSLSPLGLMLSFPWSMLAAAGNCHRPLRRRLMSQISKSAYAGKHGFTRRTPAVQPRRRHSGLSHAYSDIQIYSLQKVPFRSQWTAPPDSWYIDLGQIDVEGQLLQYLCGHGRT
jgi:hypothetical protein